ncbi:hypothetical protein JHK87_041991 [Glycine soja]|nr:hypothetical protein JHK87_041991 [Glycine soja]
MVGKLLVMRLVLVIYMLSTVILKSSAQACKNKTFNDNKVFAKCRDLPQSSSYLYWTYDQATGKLDMTFTHAGITAPERWVAWAINPNNNLKTAMVGAHAGSGGAPRAYTTSITNYSTHLEEGNISYPHSGLAATRQNNEITIYAILHQSCSPLARWSSL